VKPLWPDFADLHGPSWALIAPQTQYGVCWRDLNLTAHGEVIAKQAFFAGADGETTWSLHAKCFEICLSTFVSLIEDISKGKFSFSKTAVFDVDANQKHLLHTFGILNFSQPVKVLVSVVSKLDFVGAEFNPISLAKVHLGPTFAAVRKARSTGTLVKTT